MDNIATNVELLFEKAKNYTETSLELYKLNAIDKAADVVSSLISRIALLLFVAMFTLFVNIALSLYIGKLLGEYYYGFLVVSGFYFILSILLYFYSNKYIKMPVTNLVIAKLLKTKTVKSNSKITDDESL